MAITAPPAASSVIETGGIEAIPSNRRHGSPWQLLSTWSAPNLEFATVFVGVLAVGIFGLSIGWAVVAIVLGSAFGALTQGILSTWGPREGLAQLVHSVSLIRSRLNPRLGLAGVQVPARTMNPKDFSTVNGRP